MVDGAPNRSTTPRGTTRTGQNAFSIAFFTSVRFSFTVPVRVTEAGSRDPLLEAFGTRPCVFQWHEDTFDLPSDATLLAVGDAVANQAFRYRANAWGVQFHFEVDREGVEAWLRVAEPSLEPVWGRSADEVRDEIAIHLAGQQDQSRALFAAYAARV